MWLDIPNCCPTQTLRSCTTLELGATDLSRQASKVVDPPQAAADTMSELLGFYGVDWKFLIWADTPRKEQQ